MVVAPVLFTLPAGPVTTTPLPPAPESAMLRLLIVKLLVTLEKMDVPPIKTSLVLVGIVPKLQLPGTSHWPVTGPMKVLGVWAQPDVERIIPTMAANRG